MDLRAGGREEANGAPPTFAAAAGAKRSRCRQRRSRSGDADGLADLPAGRKPLGPPAELPCPGCTGAGLEAGSQIFDARFWPLPAGPAGVIAGVIG